MAELTLEQKRALALASARVRAGGKDYKAMSKPAEVDPTEDMNILQTGAAGLGKMIVDTGRGAKQLLGIGDQKKLQETIDAEKELSKPLMSTWGGNIGNVGGQIGLALLPGGAIARAGNMAKIPGMVAAGQAMMAPPINLAGGLIGAGMGAAQGAIQPVASDESRLANIMLPAAAGAALPVLGMGLGAMRGAVEPLYEGGRDKIIGRALRSAAGQNADDVARRMAQGASTVPGVKPTAAEVAQSGGISAMQRAASAVDPESYAFRATKNNEARIAAIEKMAGTGGERAQYEGIRGMMTEIPYEEAVKTGVDKNMASALSPQIKNLMERPSIKYAIDSAKGIMDERSVELAKSGSVEGLQLVKQALDDAIERGGNATTKIGKNQLRALQQTRSDLISVMEDIVPKLREADVAYRQWSQPINQMDVAEQILNKAKDPVSGNLQPRAFVRAISDDTVRGVTGYSGSTLKNTMTPGQMGVLTGIVKDLRGVNNLSNLGRGAGSDTVQKLSMTNLMQQSGLPMGVLNLYGMGALGRVAFSNADEAMKSRLAQAMLDPQEAARLMQAARTNPALANAINEIRKIAAPGILGGALSLNAQQ